MKKLTSITMMSLLILCSFAGQLGAQMQSLPPRAVSPLCVTCPTGSAKFCNLCVNGPAVIKDLVVQNSITFCSGVGCPCNFNGEISWNTDETHYNVKQHIVPVVPTPFQPYFNNRIYDTFTGWPVPRTPTIEQLPLVITAEFQVPLDLDPSVTPVITLHWFNQSATFLQCVGNYVNWQVTADFFTNLSPINAPVEFPKYTLTTGDILLTYYTGSQPAGYVQQQVSVPLTGQALVPGAYAQISATRIAPTGAGHVESSCASLLTLIVFQYRKKSQ